MEKKKHAGGRPPGRKVTMALQAASQAAIAIGEMTSVVDGMKDYQKVLFESIMSGDDDLTATLKAGKTEWITGIAKMVMDKDGNKMATSAVTLANYQDLDADSYARLSRLCEAHIRHITGTDDYRQYTLPIKEYIKRFTPLALGTIVNIASKGIKEENRLKAAKDLLDRAGEAAEAPEKDVIIPVQVNIMLTQQDGSIVQYDGK